MEQCNAPLIRMTDLGKCYGRGRAAMHALEEVSLSIRPGEFVAIMGPSGSGKSSLLNLIGLLDLPTSGCLSVCGTETTTAKRDELARLRNRHIGFVFQSYHLIPRRDVIGNIELPLIYRGLARKERRRRVRSAIERVGLEARRNATPAELSGGEQQRVAIARALVTDPDLIIADEPTGALDTETSGRILELLEGACADGRTVVMVTHDPHVARHASRIIRIRDGRIIRDGTSNPLGIDGMRAGTGHSPIADRSPSLAGELVR